VCNGDFFHAQKKKDTRVFGSQAKSKDHEKIIFARLLHHDNDKIQCFEFDATPMP
jgi:hypothetical protein